MSQSKLTFYRSLPAKRMGSGILFQDLEGKVLLVQPTYKETWEIPGGIVEANESPLSAALREVHEELGLQLSSHSLKLLCVEYMAGSEDITEALMFVFSGGILSHDQLNQIKLQASELKSFRFVTPKDAALLLEPVLGARIERCLQANVCFYSEARY